MSSHDADLVGDVQCLLVCGQYDVSLLLSVRAYKCVHSLDLDIVQILAGFLDLRLIGSAVNDENKSVIVFNSLNGAFSTQRMLDNGILVPCMLFWTTTLVVLWFAVQLESSRASECDFGPDLVLLLLVSSFLQRGGSFLSLWESG